MRQFRRGGFTLIELLVVISIIVLLATILLPMVSHAYNQARRASMAADLFVISQALEAYKGDFGDYPRVDRTLQQRWTSGGQPIYPVSPVTGNPIFAIGAPILCWALVAPGGAAQDGADGPGFRLRGVTGQVQGPYLPPDRFLIGTVDGVGIVHAPGTLYGIQAKFDDTQEVLADRNYSPILYFPATKGANPAANFVGVETQPYNRPEPFNSSCVFNFDDNHTYLDTSHRAVNPSTGQTVNDAGHGNPANLTRGDNEIGWKVMAYRLGDTNSDGKIDREEVPITTGPYLLWAAGPDQIFGNDDDVMSDGTQLQQVQGLLPVTIAPK